MFPGVAERVKASAAWHEINHGIKPLFGVFWNLCINALFPGQSRVHCLPHTDFKNIVGVCLLAIYQVPGKRLVSSLSRVINYSHFHRKGFQSQEKVLASSLGSWGSSLSSPPGPLLLIRLLFSITLMLILLVRPVWFLWADELIPGVLRL